MADYTRDIILADSEDASTDVFSSAVKVSGSRRAFVQCIFTGAPVGVLYLEASADPTNKADDVTEWTILKDYIVSAAGSVSIDAIRVNFKWLRVAFDAAGGTGTFTARLNLRGER
jgi:hypothetical protein